MPTPPPLFPTSGQAPSSLASSLFHPRLVLSAAATLAAAHYLALPFPAALVLLPLLLFSTAATAPVPNGGSDALYPPLALSSPPVRPTSSKRPSLPPPAGWAPVCASADILPGEVRHIATRQLHAAVYRSESSLHAVHAYCSHLGADLAVGGRVEGTSIVCPFHGFRFEGDGRCVEVPYSGKPPPATAALASWPVRERGGVVYLWLGGGEPPAAPDGPPEGLAAPAPSTVHARAVYTALGSRLGDVHARRGGGLVTWASSSAATLRRGRLSCEGRLVAPGAVLWEGRGPLGSRVAAVDLAVPVSALRHAGRVVVLGERGPRGRYDARALSRALFDSIEAKP